jgi:murein DD-endopeptidase MepM/ murein hydrolase activator NlpD
MQSKLSVTFLISLTILGSCARQPLAQIEYKGEEPRIYYHKPSSKKIPIQPLPEDGFLIVKPNQTLYSLAQMHGVPMQELIDKNELKAPYFLKAGQKLIISKPRKLENPKVEIEKEEVTQKVAIPFAIKPNNSTIATLIKENNKDIVEKPKEKKILAGRPSKDKELVKGKRVNIVTAKENFVWPVQGAVISKFGPKDGGLRNDGINISSPENTPIRAISSGVVVYTGNQVGGYGNLSIIKHDNGIISTYAHQKNILVQKGDKIQKGQIIGYVGSTGNVSSPQLHLVMRKGKKPVNPELYLAKK